MRSILITNDDGILADGFLRLAKAAQAFGTVFAVAPESQRSAASHSITLHSHIDLFPQEFPVPGIRAYACSGTPADCVRVGSLALLPVKPDVVISGINYGYNAATDLQYSATVGAAFEAAFQGIHAIALSEGASSCHEVTDAYLHEILAELLEQPLGYGEIHNVNFPDCPLAECRGILRGRKVSRGMFFRDSYRVLETFPDGGMRMEVDGAYNEDAEPETDFRAIVDHYVSVGTARNIT